MAISDRRHLKLNGDLVKLFYLPRAKKGVWSQKSQRGNRNYIIRPDCPGMPGHNRVCYRVDVDRMAPLTDVEPRRTASIADMIYSPSLAIYFPSLIRPRFGPARALLDSRCPVANVLRCYSGLPSGAVRRGTNVSIPRVDRLRPSR